MSENRSSIGGAKGMKVAFIGSECYPFVKTGGLGDVMYALPRALSKLNCDVKVLLPRYRSRHMIAVTPQTVGMVYIRLGLQQSLTQVSRDTENCLLIVSHRLNPYFSASHERLNRLRHEHLSLHVCTVIERT